MNKQLVAEIREIFFNQELSDEAKKTELSQYHEGDLADALETMTKDERLAFYKILGVESTSEVLTYMEDVEDYIHELDYDKAAELIEQMDADDAIDVLEEVDEVNRDEIIKRMEGELVEEIKMISAYDDDQIGSHMTTNYITTKLSQSVPLAMKHVIAEAAVNDNVAVIYVVDDENKLKGAIQLRDLIIARKDTELAEIIKSSYPSVLATSLVSDCIQELKDYAVESLPVVDEDDRLLGVITSEDIIELASSEQSEDYAKFAGLTSIEEIEEPITLSVRKRMPWLVILLGFNTVVAIIISSFESVITALPLLVFFQSAILAMAGNSGTQSLAVMIHNLATEDVKTAAKSIGKEITVSAINGLLLGALSFGFITLFLIIKKEPIIPDTAYNMHDVLKVAGIVSCSMFMGMTISGFLGTCLPLLLKSFKVDPAVASGPFMTTFNDIIAVTIYYGLAIALFHSIL